MADKKKVPIPAAGQASDKKRALETALAQIEKNYGKGTIMRLGDDIPVNVEAIPRALSPWTWRWASAACRAAAS
jgi:recombination protein RecA